MNKTFPKTTLVVCTLSILFLGLACGKSATSTNENAAAPAASPASNTAAAPVSASNEIAGDYTITGTNEGGGGQYGGDLRITKRDSVYQFTWLSGSKTYDGVGVRTDNNVAVAFTEGTDGKGCGVVLYKIDGDRSLDGTVGYWGVNDAASETAKRTSGSDLDGTYDVAGANPDGSPYKGKLAVNKQGQGYTFEWSAGSTSKGFGIRGGDKVAVGIGGSQCGFVSYEINADGSLNGKWGGPGTTSVGTEIAKRK